MIDRTDCRQVAHEDWAYGEAHSINPLPGKAHLARQDYRRQEIGRADRALVDGCQVAFPRAPAGGEVQQVVSWIRKFFRQG